MRKRSEVNLSPAVTPMSGAGYTPEEALAEANRCLDCPAQYCRRDCPIHTPVPEMCRKIREGDLSGAHEILVENNPLTDMTCRVCPAEKQCRKNCTRSIRGEAVNIPALERFVNERHGRTETENRPESGGKRTAIVGAGPAGMVCAEELRRAGAEVSIYDRSEKIGGVPRWGIPDFVLPEAVTEAAAERLCAMGVEFIGGKTLGKDLTLDWLRERYDAVFLAFGAPTPVTGGFEQTMQAQTLLHEASLGRNPLNGRSVAVFGGGDTAIDAARVAVRLGSRSVTVVYRRGREEMPARVEDVRTAEEEGVSFLWWTEPVQTENGHILCRKTESAPPDYPGGRNNARSLAGTEFELEADVPVLALGFRNAPADGVPCDRQGRVLTDGEGRTGVSGVFAGGDATAGPSTVVKAAAAGKRAAQAILQYLSGQN